MVNNPSLAFGAPQTTFNKSFSPTSTSQTFSLSASGCFSVLIIFAILKESKSDNGVSTFSTSSPMSVNFSIN